jgi:hypothetical protein
VRLDFTARIGRPRSCKGKIGRSLTHVVGNKLGDRLSTRGHYQAYSFR